MHRERERKLRHCKEEKGGTHIIIKICKQQNENQKFCIKTEDE